MADADHPALVVEHGPRELKQHPPGGGGRKLFADLTAGLRTKTANSWVGVAQAALSTAKQSQFDAGVVKVKLREKAIAKSHRPRYLFQSAGRGQIIGSSAIGTLLVAVTDESLEATAQAMRENSTADGEADLTTIESISAYEPADVTYTPFNRAEAYRHGAVVTVFDFREPERNASARGAIELILRQAAVDFTQRDVSRLLVRTDDRAVLQALASHPAVRKIWPNAAVRSLVPNAIGAQPAHLPTPQPNVTYPIVGVLDSGVSVDATPLAPWILPGPSFPAGAFLPGDSSHGTFIAGLIAGGSVLNPGVNPMPDGPCRILPARVFSPREPIGIEDLIPRIEASVRAHPEVRVWNLSLGLDELCLGPEFSPFACELDEIAHRHQVLFVIAAGNYTSPPLRPWPADAWYAGGDANRDLIGAPADAVLGLSVGAVAHAHGNQSAVKGSEPTGYSRRGPAPGLLPKPEVTHYGGNCSAQNTPDGHGIASIAPDGQRILDWGTSYAAPLVASVAAHGWSRLIQASHHASPEIVRALVIHAAALKADPQRADNLRYMGFGTPGSLDAAFMCDPSAFTTWHRVFIPRGQFVEHEFPMPDCLMEGGKFSGEVVVTLCYAPPLDAASGAEYCRANVNVAMGIFKRRNTRRLNPKTGKKEVVSVDGFRSEVPPDPKSPGEGFESSLIAHGFKWSPVKVYRSRFPRGIDGKRWQLRFEVLYRDGQEPPDQPQEAFAIVTVRGLGQNQPVYRDGVRALNQKGHVAHSAIAMGTRVR